MAKSLVIVESPAKAKTINKFLGPDYIVKPTGGHVIDLPPDEIGVNVDNGFEPKYEIIKGKSKIITDLKKTAQSSDVVLLATDPDREGEAIAWHVKNSIVKEGQQYYRVLFNQITKDAVVNAINNKQELDLNKVNAQQARRVLDRLVGYMVSPFLWKTLYSGLSAGRVQSVALRLIVERDREIEAFVTEEYWEINALLSTVEKDEFEVKLIKKNGKAFKIKDSGESDTAIKEIESSSFSVESVNKKKTKKNPLPPFITSTLQQEAARRLNYTVARTMSIAQELYEGLEIDGGSTGLITYMRTDSTRIAPEAIDDARNYIKNRWGASELPDKPNIYKTKKSAQDAHEAIRPSSVDITPEKLKGQIKDEHLKLYTLIWNRFVASQMKPAEFMVITVDVTAGEYLFRATSSLLVYKGHFAVYEDVKKDEEEDEFYTSSLPEKIKKGDSLNLMKLTPSQHFTKPPFRYSEASLVKELEALGIGRPSTYAQIINTLLAREYVNREKGKLLSTELGGNVNKILVGGFPDLFNVKFTAGMEDDLDKIESGDSEWLNVVHNFYGPFKKSLEDVNSRRTELKQSLIEESGEICERCGKPMIIRWGKKGKFMACSGFPACRNTKPLEDTPVELTGEVCEKCGSPMEVKSGKFGKFMACSNYPKCKNIKPYSLGIKCPEKGCDGSILEKKTKKGRTFYGCSKYPGCKFASWEKPVAKDCPDCGSPTLIPESKGETLKCPSCENKFNREDLGL